MAESGAQTIDAGPIHTEGQGVTSTTETPPTGLTPEQAAARGVLASGSSTIDALSGLANANAQRNLENTSPPRLAITSGPETPSVEGVRTDEIPRTEEAADGSRKREPHHAPSRVLSQAESARLRNDASIIDAEVISETTEESSVPYTESERTQARNESVPPSADQQTESNRADYKEDGMTPGKFKLIFGTLHDPFETLEIAQANPAEVTEEISTAEKVVKEVEDLQKEIQARLDAAKAGEETPQVDLVEETINKLEQANLSTQDLIAEAVNAKSPLQQVIAAVLAKERPDFRQAILTDMSDDKLRCLVMATPFASEDNILARKILGTRNTSSQLAAMVAEDMAIDIKSSEYATITDVRVAETKLKEVEGMPDGPDKARKEKVLYAVWWGLAISGGAALTLTSAPPASVPKS